MKPYILAAVAVMAVGPVNARIVFDQPVAPVQGTCIVADPTGTPLNVRTGPSAVLGSTVDKLANGTEVEILHQQVNWAFVRSRHGYGSGGWVYSPFLTACSRVRD